MNVHVRQLVEEREHGVLLLLVDQGEDRLLESHEGDQSLEPAAVEEPYHVGFSVVQVILVGLGGTFPVPAVDIGFLKDFFPVVGILKGVIAGLDHAASDLGHVDPFDTEHIESAGFLKVVERHTVCNKAASDIVGDDGGAQGGALHVRGHPDGILVPVEAGVRLLGGHGEVVQRQGLAAEVHGFGYDFQFFLVKGKLAHFHSSCKVLCVIPLCRTARCGSRGKWLPSVPEAP